MLGRQPIQLRTAQPCRARSDDERGTGQVNIAYVALPIRNTVDLQTEQVPRVAGRPFFKVTCRGLDISRLLRHLKQ